ncbi:Bifunctional epoxide hydrolase 2 [Tolypocladium capitatum]|uniref:Bifunctional epoxide hydrolase 2 n=1 Tax=Tolypocladium capitatum TaxID=45235 RepID=A0A2K3QK71_9HYPO|nr:Bifunctional epoxide hydrolase 2 [Tolypocladium capitatum]
MDTSKLIPNDPRVKYESAQIRGKTYKYIVGEPQTNPPVDTIFLIHGFPDMGFGWRYQVPYFISLGFRVVVPDMLGYGGTDTPEDLNAFSFKSLSADIKEFARKFVGDGQIILGGHDWGGALVWRVALWHPELIKAVFSICTPFNAPTKPWIALEDMIAAGKLTNFTYQLQFKGPEVENTIQGEEKVRQFLNGMWGGFGPDREIAFVAEKGVLLDNLPKLRRCALLSDEELDYYVRQYMLQKAPQLHGPLNWYRTRKINWEDELPLADKPVTLEMPTLFIAASRDTALPPSMSVGMEKYMPRLTRGEVAGSHWALTGASEDVNGQVAKWLEGVLNGATKSAL